MAQIDVDPQAIIAKLREALAESQYQNAVLRAAIDQQEAELAPFREQQRLEDLMGKPESVGHE